MCKKKNHIAKINRFIATTDKITNKNKTKNYA